MANMTDSTLEQIALNLFASLGWHSRGVLQYASTLVNAIDESRRHHDWINEFVPKIDSCRLWRNYTYFHDSLVGSRPWGFLLK